tara:strand:- start:759 stop:1466 length:708 start_codon:yes stop_codon:yes gene_type:complete
MIDLIIIIPFYNEEEIVKTVINEWNSKLKISDIKYEIHAYNDGSGDNTLNILNNLEKKIDNLVVIDKENTGHGPTILIGYKNASSKWIFQVDGDSEISSDYFMEFWNQRHDKDLVIGYRINRYRSFNFRRLISFTASFFIKIFYGGMINDVNCPYRLINREIFKPYIDKIYDKTFAPNVIISGIANLKGLRVNQMPILYNIRTTGTFSLTNYNILFNSAKSFFQLIFYRLYRINK